MAEINVFQYAVINRPGSSPVVIGSKNKPSTITLTGTGEVLHRVYNDIVGPAVTVLYESTLTGIKWFAVKASVDIVIAHGGTTDSGSYPDTSSIGVTAGRWQFFYNGTTTLNQGSNVEGRPTNNACDIIKVVAFNLTDADIEFIAAY